jgi:hypothetical protein
MLSESGWPEGEAPAGLKEHSADAAKNAMLRSRQDELNHLLKLLARARQSTDQSPFDAAGVKRTGKQNWLASEGSGGSNPSNRPGVSPNTVAYDVALRYRVPERPAKPLVAAVSPMTDADVLDLSGSVRVQRAFALSAALALSYAGLNGQAAIFNQWAKRLETDVQTRGASTAISTYSHSGGSFGFQIGPRLRAIEQAGGKSESDRRAAAILERQTFPVLIVLGMDADDLGIRFAYRGGEFMSFEPVLKFRQTMRWVPVQQPDAVLNSHYGSPYDPKNERYWRRLEDRGLRRGVGEATRMQWLRGLGEASAVIPTSRTSIASGFWT